MFQRLQDHVDLVDAAAGVSGSGVRQRGEAAVAQLPRRAILPSVDASSTRSPLVEVDGGDAGDDPRRVSELVVDRYLTMDSFTAPHRNHAAGQRSTRRAARRARPSAEVSFASCRRRPLLRSRLASQRARGLDGRRQIAAAAPSPDAAICGPAKRAGAGAARHSGPGCGRDQSPSSRLVYEHVTSPSSPGLVDVAALTSRRCPADTLRDQEARRRLRPPRRFPTTRWSRQAQPASLSALRATIFGVARRRAASRLAGSSQSGSPQVACQHRIDHDRSRV